MAVNLTNIKATAEGDSSTTNVTTPPPMDQFDFIRFTVADINGIGRCKSVPKRHFKHYMNRGVDLFAGLLALGPNSEITPMPEVDPINDGNAIVYPCPETLRALPWAAGGNYQVGEVLCETRWTPPYREGGPQAACPRYIARKMLQNLSDFGYSLYSSFEAEFMSFKRGTFTPIYPDEDIFTTLDFAEFESYTYWLDENLSAVGVDIGTLQTEHAPGQFEFALKPQFGIESGDSMTRLKQYVKELSKIKDIDATFMTKPYHPSYSNGLHFNHSLWKGEINAFHDPTAPDNLSDLARHWIAGLIRHGPALVALNAPTVNCYRRLRVEPAPDRIDWGIQDRFTAFRVKNINEKETYVESRLPCGSANPYLILAATVAAGLDGIREKMVLPPPRQPGSKISQGEGIPGSLGEALVALEGDKVMVEALGEEFVRWFCQCKRDTEINALRAGIIEQEQRLYFKLF